MMRCVDCGCIIASGPRCCNCSRIYYRNKDIEDVEERLEDMFVDRRSWSNAAVRKYHISKLILSIMKEPKCYNEIKRNTGMGGRAIKGCVAQLVREGVVVEIPSGSKKMIELRIGNYDAHRKIQATVA